MEKLKIGILIDSYDQAAWSSAMINNIIQSDFAQIKLVLIDDNPKPIPNHSLIEKITNNSGRIFSVITRKLCEIIYNKIIERNVYLPSSDAVVNIQPELEDIPTLKIKTLKKKISEYFLESDLEEIKKYDLDIIVRAGFGILRGEILNLPKFGIWSFHHGDNQLNRGGPAGFWESLEGWPETGSILQILSEDLDNGKVLYRSFSCTDSLSIQDNRNNYYWKTLSFMTRKMKELHRDGEAVFFSNVDKLNEAPSFYSRKLYKNPTCREYAFLVLNKLKEKVSTVIGNKFYMNQWILMFHMKKEFSSSLWRYKKIVPPKDRFWADPHIIFKNNKYYIYIEELLYATQKGHISLIEMDAKGNYSEPETVLDLPYHLSYPYVFEYENEYYMIPESIENKTVELYKCSEFPKKWDFQMNLMENIEAVDVTPLFHNGKWWLFANCIETKGASSWDELYLFSSENLLSQDWKPHKNNPVISDCKSSRPAGKIFKEGSKIYRPSQNCSVRYGYGFNISEIIHLDDDRYEERIVSKVEPHWDKEIIGTHTFNRTENLHIIDAIFRRRR